MFLNDRILIRVVWEHLFYFIVRFCSASFILQDIFHTEGQSEPDDRHLGCGASQARLSPAECTRAFARDACRRHGQDGATARGRAFLGSLLRLGNDTDRGGYADDKYGTGTEKRLCRGGISFHRQGDMGEREKRSARGDKYGDNL